MPLSNQAFSVMALTEAISLIPNKPNIIDGLGIFKKEYKNTTFVQVERASHGVGLVESVKRGTPGNPVSENREPPQTFYMLHLPYDDFVLADDVQNIREFGTTNGLKQIATLVNNKLAIARENFDYTREHAMFGALKGKVLNKDGTTVLADYYTAFGETRKEHQWQLTNDKTDVSGLIDDIKLKYASQMKGESSNGFICLISPQFMQELKTHKSIKDIYVRHQTGDVYRNSAGVEFAHNGVRFIVYGEEFESGLKLADDEGIILPTGTRNVFKECFAPANRLDTVNQIAQSYFADKYKLPDNTGYKLHAQCNPLPLVLRPDLVQTIKLT